MILIFKMNLDVSNDIYRSIYNNIHITVKWKKKLPGNEYANQMLNT